MKNFPSTPGVGRRLGAAFAALSLVLAACVVVAGNL